MRHRVGSGGCGCTVGACESNWGYDGMELIYGSYGDYRHNHKTLERWKDELEDEKLLVTEAHPPDFTWTTDGPPDLVGRDCLHPFVVGASNVLRWWMGPYNRYYGKNVTYIRAREFNAYKNDYNESGSGLIHPLGYFLKTGKTVASGRGSFATFWLSTTCDREYPGETSYYGGGLHRKCQDNWYCGDHLTSIGPGDIIAWKKGCCDYQYRKTEDDVRIRILAKSAFSFGYPIKAKLYINNEDLPEEQLLKEYGSFSSWDLSTECPEAGDPCSTNNTENIKINDSDEVWYYIDEDFDEDDLGDPPWYIRLEVEFYVPGMHPNEKVFTSPVYSKY
jgi:hypothetical protein